MAVRHGPYKLHFVTRSGFGFERPVVHDPPLLFNVEVDAAESHLLDVTLNADIVNTIIAAAEAHKASVVPGSPQYDFKHEGPVPGNDWSVIPCCQRNFFAEEERSAFPPEDWSLIVWRDCICPRNARGQAEAVFRPYDDVMKTKFMGFQLLDYQHMVDSIKD